MNLETKIIIYKFTPQVFTLTRFFLFSVSARITIKNKSCVGLFVGFLPVLLYSSDELELSCGIIGNSGTNIRKSYTPSLVLSRYLCHQKFSKKNRVI